MRQQRNRPMPNSIAGFLIACLWAMLLAACGGGGGSPGVNPNKPADSGPGTSKVSSIVITTSSDTMPSSGSVTVNVLAKDANNNVVPDAIIDIAVTNGASLSRNNVDRKTDKNGLITETLTSPGDSSARTIKITASTPGASTSKEVKVEGVKPSLSLSVSSNSLDSSGADGSEVTVVAVVRDAGNNVVPGVMVYLSASSGSLTNTNRVTDANGRVSEKLSTGNDKTARDIKLTARTDTIANQELIVKVQGHKVQIGTIESANLGKVTKLSAILSDSAGKPLPNVEMTFSAASAGNVLVETGTGKTGSTKTDSQGQIQLDYTPKAGSTDTITVSALGVSASRVININTLNFTVQAFKVVGDKEEPLNLSYINNCVSFRAHVDNGGTPQTGSVGLSSTRGVVYRDSACSTPLSGTVTLDAKGEAVAWIKADTPGVATLVASLQDASGALANSEVEFIAPVESTSYVVLQVDPTVVALGKPATVRAVVRDGTAKDNLVKNAVLAFIIKEDPSGGKLAQPSVVKTDADGSAVVVYTAGNVTTKVDGVVLQARIQSKDKNGNDLPVVNGKNPAEAKLTVSGQALFISAGTGSTTLTPNSATYAVDYAVFVTDATGNPVSNATITAKVVPALYRKGNLVYFSDAKLWSLPARTAYNECSNEDLNRNGILDSGEDYNANGRLDPGIPITISGSLTTDASGTGLVRIAYPRDRAQWTVADITITARVAGTEATYVASLVQLPGLSDDYKEATVSPPGQSSPYGTRVAVGNDVLGCQYAN
ncbi:Ig-like domain-containing protein [Massilia sp. W12]|uniref:Ig-like domain-containing protein n=1 Tax=Massilia sp. W12 TaxID=3126507 RepID=UPI0030CE8941